MTLIEEAITEWFGERCPDYEYGCSTCDAWAEYDERVTETEPVVSFGERLIEAATEAVTMAKLMRENEELRWELEKWRPLHPNPADARYWEGRFRDADAKLAGERALSADLARAVSLYCPWEHGSLKAYRKARGL